MIEAAEWPWLPLATTLLTNIQEAGIMTVMSIHIDETLDERDISKLKETLAVIPHVINVELNTSMPHDLIVECHSHYNMSGVILDKLSRQGLHSEIQAC